jgi:hypothetical protein
MIPRWSLVPDRHRLPQHSRAPLAARKTTRREWLPPLGWVSSGLQTDDVHRLDLAKVERAVIDGEADGFVALYTHNGVIVGATFVAAHAGESLPLLTLAVAQRMTPADLAAVIACYPTQVEAIQRVAAQASTS